jgi:tetratricopeptide (TPR) repeat protein
MLFSGVVHGEPLKEGVTIDGIYYGKGYDPENPNLVVGGILQNGPNPDDNPDLKKFADDNHAIYDPAYCSGNSVLNIKKDALAVNEASLGEKTDYNGLKSSTLDGKKYNTIIAYSGGTATAVTALAKESVTCDTLILISPMAAGVPDGKSKIDALVSEAGKKYSGTGLAGSLQRGNEQKEIDKLKEEAKKTARKNFEDQIDKILSGGDSAAVKNIIVIQSKEDKLPYGDVFQYRVPEANDPNAPSWRNKIEVNDINLGFVLNGHEAIFKTYAMNNIKNGVCTDLNTPQSGLGGTIPFHAADSNNAEALNNKGNVLKNQGKHDEANQLLGKIQEKQQPKTAATTTQKRSGAFVIDYTSGHEVFSSMETARNAENAKNAERREIGLQEAATLCAQGKYDEAIQVYKIATGWSEADDSEAGDIPYAWMYNDIGDALFKQEKYDEAIQVYKKILNRDSKGYEYWLVTAWTRIGDALKALGHTTEADATYAKADEVQQELRQLQESPQSQWQEEENMVMRSGGTGTSPSSTPDTGWIEEKIRSEMADENSDLVTGLQDYVNKA